MFVGANPIDVYTALLYGAFGDLNKIANTLARATPIIFTGLAVIVGAIWATIPGILKAVRGVHEVINTIMLLTYCGKQP